MSDFDKLTGDSSAKDSGGTDDLFHQSEAAGTSGTDPWDGKDPWGEEFSSTASSAYTSTANREEKKGNSKMVILVVVLFSVVLLGVGVAGVLYVGGLGKAMVNQVTDAGDYEELLDYIEDFQNDKLEAYLKVNTEYIDYYDRLVYAPLYHAVLVGNYEAMGILLDYGADINLADGISDLSSALAFALYYGDYEASALLVERGIDVNTRDSVGMTPLMYATGFDEPEFVELLLSAGALAEDTDDYSWSVLHYAAFYGCKNNYDLVVAAGASEDALTDEGYNVAHAALYSENLDFLQELIGKGYELVQPTASGDTLLHIASTEVMTNYVMANYDCDFNAKNDEGETPLHRAAQSRVPASVVINFLEHGADPDAQSKGGVTPLMCALADQGKVEALLSYGADKTIEDRYGATAYDYISLYYSEDMISDAVIDMLQD